ncbi:MAG: hypothetical protein NXH75_16680, partial [Halobacteriovoraceae bacterium]|nr:hypothetical protein [Halobacteriovoraceae bacterium]
MKFATFLFVFFLLLLPKHALGFLNIESLRQEKGNPGKLKGSTGVRFTDSRGNVERSQVRLNTLNMLKNGDSSYLFLAQY